MNIYTALHGNGDSPIGKFAWGSLVLGAINLQLPEDKRFKFESTCREVLDGILNMDNPIRQEVLKMDVPGDEVEAVKEGMRSKVITWTSATLLVSAMLIVGMYVSSTSPDNLNQGVLDSLFNFMGQVLKILSPGTVPEAGS